MTGQIVQEALDRKKGMSIPELEALLQKVTLLGVNVNKCKLKAKVGLRSQIQELTVEYDF